MVSPQALSPTLTFTLCTEVIEGPCLSLLCRLSVSVLLHLYVLMRCLYAAYIYGIAVLEPKHQDFWCS